MTGRRRWIPSPNGDEGTVLMLGIGLVIVCVLTVVALIDVSAVFLQRQQLFAIADSAAIAGAQAIDLPDYYAKGATTATRLDPAAVRSRVDRHLVRADARGSVPGLDVSRVWSDGSHVVVDLTAPVRLPFLSTLFRGEIAVESWAQLAYHPSG